MSPRNIKLILRTAVLLLAALTLALAVRVVLENKELMKLLPTTPTRTQLLILAPLTTLAILHFSLAVRSFAARSLIIELAMLLGIAALFIALVAPHLLGQWVSFPVEDCGRWLRSCPDEVIWVPLWWTSPAGFGMSGLLLAAAWVCAFWQERHSPRDAKGR